MEPRKTFQSPYTEYKQHIGKAFSINKEVDPIDNSETGKQYEITVSTGETFIAWPEEIYTGTGWEPLY